MSVLLPLAPKLSRTHISLIFLDYPVVVYIKRPLSLSNYWIEKCPIFFAEMC